ncbi:MAG TPA: UMP kinase [Candidatus Woesebacteria bacterium]|nr:UMP kinase [Candidatus Woesebacteria bacterium]
MLFDPKEPPIVISIGGSLIAPKDGVDPKFLAKLNEFVRTYVKQGKRFFLVSGGGRLARTYRDAGKSVIGNMTESDLDWLGIHATRLNAHLLRTIFADIANPRIIENYDKRLTDWKEPVVIGAGWKPGWSTDYDAVMLAKDYGANLVINLSNIYYVYDKDPNKYTDAKAIKKLTWEELEKLVGTEWSPGINAPFDPIAAQLAKKMGLTVIVTHGEDFKNLSNILEGDSFRGTVIMPYRIDASFYDREYYMGNKCGYKFVQQESFVGRWLRWLANYYRAFLIRIFLNPRTCLDVGCGTGELVGMLRSFGIDAYGVEISEHALELAEKSVRPFLKQGDITKLPYKTDEFDVVVSYDVLEHVERSKIKQAINETIRVSRKFILHKIYTRENLWMKYIHNADKSHISVFSKKFWQKLFLENEAATLLRNSFFRLPSFMESVFLLKKK